MRRRREALNVCAEDLPTLSPAAKQLLVGLLVVLLVVGLLFFLHQRSHSPAPSNSGSVRVATWNLRFFSTHRKSMPDPDFAAIARIIRDNHFDVLAIQEVKGRGEAVDELLHMLGSPYRASSLSPETGNGERFAFVYDSSRVRDLQNETPIDCPENAFSRHPYQGTFESGAMTFTLVTCHIYYGAEASGHRRREQEIETLAQYARRLESHTRNVVVLGDFNEQHNWPNLYNFTDTGWRKLIFDQTNLGAARSSETFDNILMDQRDVSAWTGVSGSVPWDIALYRDDVGPASQRQEAEHEAANHISDHRPAYADFFAVPARPAPFDRPG